MRTVKNKNRRTTKGYKLRVYVDAIKDARATTDAEWIEAWAKNPIHSKYVPRIVWIGYLEHCALIEADKYLGMEAA